MVTGTNYFCPQCKKPIRGCVLDRPCLDCAVSNMTQKIYSYKIKKEDRPKPRLGVQYSKTEKDKTKYTRKAKHKKEV